MQKYVLAAATALLATGTSILINRFAPERINVVIVFVVIAGLVVAFDHLRGLHAERQERQRPTLLGPDAAGPLNRPNIQAARIFTDTRTLIAVGVPQPHANIHCAHVIFKNVPTPGSHPDAQVSDVLAEIKFVRHGQVALTVSPGRWGDTEQPAVRKALNPFASLIDLNAIPFRIGEEHELNIAVKHPEAAFFYGFNNQTYDHANWENPAYRLDGESYEVIVRLFGRNVDEEFRFTLRNLGAGAGLELAVIG